MLIVIENNGKSEKQKHEKGTYKSGFNDKNLTNPPLNKEVLILETE